MLLHLPVFWIPFLAKTVQVESHRQEFYLFKREKIKKKLSIKKIGGNYNTPANQNTICPTILKLQSEPGKVSIKQEVSRMEDWQAIQERVNQKREVVVSH